MKCMSYSIKGDTFRGHRRWGPKSTLFGCIMTLVRFWLTAGNGPCVYDEITFRIDRQRRYRIV